MGLEDQLFSGFAPAGGILEGSFIPSDPFPFIFHFQMVEVVLKDCSLLPSSPYASVPHPPVAVVVL